MYPDDPPGREPTSIDGAAGDQASPGVTVEAIGREDERAWKSPYGEPAEQPATQAINPDWLSTSSEDARRRLMSDDPTRTQYIKKVTSPRDVFEDTSRKDVGEEEDAA